LDHFGSFNVKGIGLATFQYLRILCGSDTVKPDIHIRQAVSDGLNERVTNDKRVIALVEAAAFSLQISARILEYSIWLHYSEGAKTRLRRCPQV
jgi:hypothetical protein